MPASCILIVDDDALLREAYARAFEAHAFKVLTASDGTEVPYLLETEAIDIVLLDVFMQDKDGLQTLLGIKHDHPNVRVYVMTAGYEGRFDFLAVAKKFGANGVLQKPMPPFDAVRAIEDDLRAPPAHAPGSTGWAAP